MVSFLINPRTASETALDVRFLKEPRIGYCACYSLGICEKSPTRPFMTMVISYYLFLSQWIASVVARVCVLLIRS